MKASLTFREDQRPLARAKIPISVLGLPLSSGVSAGGARDLRLDLATAFDSGPSLRLSYRPNDPSNPLSLVLKTGIGALGSPIAAPMSMSAEFSLAGTSPAFSLHFKPRFGDFCVKKKSPDSPPIATKKPENDEEWIETPPLGFLPDNGAHSGKKASGFPANLHDAGGIQNLLSGVEIAARSVLPLRNHAAVRFRWGLKAPPELRAAFCEDGRGAGVALTKLPLLVMSKISIERVAPPPPPPPPPAAKVGAGEVAAACLSLERQLEALRGENALMRKAMEELRTEVGGFPAARFGGNHIAGAAAGGGGGVGAGKAVPKPAPPRDRRSEGKKPEIGGRAAPGDVNEELKKALMSATTAGA